MKKRKKTRKKSKKAIDKVLSKPRRGRPPKANRSEVVNRAYDYALTFEQRWDKFEHVLIRTKTELEFEKCLEEAYSNPRSKFPPGLFPLVQETRKDKKFPKTKKARIKFFAESLAALGDATPRYSRQLCADDRKYPTHIIISRDYYIECSCGYEGPARRGRCRECDTMYVSPMASSPDFI